MKKQRENWEENSFIEIIKPYSRIENIRTTSLLDIAQFGERYNPLKPHKPNIIAKFVATFPLVLLLASLWMRIFFPFELDNLFGDGFLVATPSIVQIVDGIPVELEVSVDRGNKIRLTLNQPAKDRPLHEEYLFGTPDELFSQENLRIGKITAKDRSKEITPVVLSGLITILFTWGLLYMWFPKMFLFDNKKKANRFRSFSLAKCKVACHKRYTYQVRRI